MRNERTRQPPELFVPVFIALMPRRDARRFVSDIVSHGAMRRRARQARDIGSGIHIVVYPIEVAAQDTRVTPRPGAA